MCRITGNRRTKSYQAYVGRIFGYYSGTITGSGNYAYEGMNGGYGEIFNSNAAANGSDVISIGRFPSLNSQQEASDHPIVSVQNAVLKQSSFFTPDPFAAALLLNI